MNIPQPDRNERPSSLFPFRPHDPLRTVEIDIDVWTKIVWAAQESDDWKLRTLIEQAVMGPVRAPGNG